jgi:hypothetical protein
MDFVGRERSKVKNLIFGIVGIIGLVLWFIGIPITFLITLWDVISWSVFWKIALTLLIIGGLSVGIAVISEEI